METGQVYVGSIVDSDIAVINGATCNGQVTSGCQPRLLRLRIGGCGPPTSAWTQATAPCT